MLRSIKARKNLFFTGFFTAVTSINPLAQIGVKDKKTGLLSNLCNEQYK
jgi:hypothetical protein